MQQRIPTTTELSQTLLLPSEEMDEQRQNILEYRRQRRRQLTPQERDRRRIRERLRRQLLTDEQRERIREVRRKRLQENEQVRERNRISQRLRRQRARIAQHHNNDSQRYDALTTMPQKIPTTTEVSEALLLPNEGEICSTRSNSLNQSSRLINIRRQARSIAAQSVATPSELGHHRGNACERVEGSNQSGGIRSLSNQRRLRLTELRRQARFIIDQPINEIQSRNIEDAYLDEGCRLEEQKEEVAEKVDEEVKPSITDPSAGATSNSNGFDGKPEINKVPMEETQALNKDQSAPQELNVTNLDLSLGLKAHHGDCGSQRRIRTKRVSWRD